MRSTHIGVKGFTVRSIALGRSRVTYHRDAGTRPTLEKVSHGCELTVRRMLLEPKTAQAIAVALHELAISAAKYGALSDGKGRVEVTWSCADGQLSLRWTETGGPPVKTPRRQGFGTHIVGRIVRQQSKGEMRLD